MTVRFASWQEDAPAIIAIRNTVFRDEQHIIQLDVTDEDDPRSVHAIAEVDGQVVSIGRLTHLEPPRQSYIAWVATLEPWRSRGGARAVMQTLLLAADGQGIPLIVLSAQTHALPFYSSLGFVPFGNRFSVRGIEHQAMARQRR